jgi:hypothetical protein
LRDDGVLGPTQKHKCWALPKSTSAKDLRGHCPKAESMVFRLYFFQDYHYLKDFPFSPLQLQIDGLSMGIIFTVF